MSKTPLKVGDLVEDKTGSFRSVFRILDINEVSERALCQSVGTNKNGRIQYNPSRRDESYRNLSGLVHV